MDPAARIARLAAHLSPQRQQDEQQQHMSSSSGCSNHSAQAHHGLPLLAGQRATRLSAEPTAAADADSAAADVLTYHQRCYNFEPGRLLLGQVALITGAGAGIGRAAAILFAHHGAKVVVSDLDAAAAQATADFIRNSHGTAVVVAGDMTEEGFPQRLVAGTLLAFGGELHILVNNAGYTWDGTIHKMSAKQWDAMLAVHCTAPFRLIQAAAPCMREAAKREMEQHGAAHNRCIINVSSVSGVHGSAGQANYATAKAGVVGLTKTVAREWGHLNIRCNCLSFGYINTRLVQPKERGAAIEVGGQRVPLGIPGANKTAAAAKMMIALGRVGAPEEAAGAMLLLASPYASYITGQTVEVTGGGWL